MTKLIGWVRCRFPALTKASLRIRLLLLVLVAALPPTILLIYLQIHLREERRQRLAEDVLGEAELLNADVASVVESARQLAISISYFPTVRNADPACRDRLLALRADLPFYTILSVFTGDGRRICSTDPSAPPALTATQAAHVQRVLASGTFEVGLVDPAGGAQSVLPFCLPIMLADGRRGVVIEDLSLDWFSRHLGELDRPPHSTIGIADGRGLTVARYPDPAGWVGKPFPPAVRPFIHAAHAGTAVVIGYDGQPRLVGFVPASQKPIGLFVSIGVLLPPLLADIDRATRIGALIAVAGAAISFLLAWSMGERLLRRPTEALLNAAHRWSGGDLAARAPVTEAPGSEFGRLALAFNAMAEALGRHQEGLERTVAERTQQWRETCEQLQCEIAERERSEASLLQAQKLQAVGQLAGGVAHDFNNLLAVIVGSLELAAIRLQTAPGSAARNVQNALNAAERGARLTRQLLAFARRERLSPSAIDLNRIIAGMRGLLTSTLGPAIELAMQFDPELPPALADSGFVELAILNLAINARDAMPGGGRLTISTRTLPALSEDGQPTNYVAIAVSDAGTGMTPDVLERAFEPFFTTKAPGSGSGLGLSQVHGLATKSGGDVRIDTELGVGTTVTVLLPRASAPAAPAASETGERSAQCRAVRILAVDDDPEVRHVLEDALRGLGHTVMLARDGGEALAILKDRRSAVDLLVTDYAMPGMSGRELIGAARRIRPGLGALLVTGRAEVGDLDADDFEILRKPFHMQSLTLYVSRAMARCKEGASRSRELPTELHVV